MRKAIAVEVNGKAYKRDVDVRTLLSDFLRHELSLHGTHVGCEHGVCGACTILLDEKPVRSCLLLAVQADGCTITTVEGLSAAGDLSPLQRAFHEHHALQCGFCTPGILITLTDYLKDHPDPSDAEIRHVLAGHLCRCTGYQPMIEAVRRK